MPHPLATSALRRRLVLGVVVAVTGGVLALSPASAGGPAPTSVQAAAPGVVEVRVLSGRADLVTGDDALIEVAVPAGVALSDVRVDVDGRDVTAAFRARDGVLRGLVAGLPLGDSSVRAVLPDGRGARLAVRNAPIGGPVFSGPQIEPWTCTEGAQDEQCNRPPVITYHYKPLLGTGLRDYDPQNPPADVATTTTDEGNEVPFIVRQETGVSVRDEYRIAALFDPSQPVDPTADNPGFADKLVLTHGFSCDTSYEMGAAPDVLLADALGQGFAVASHALDNAGHSCNLVTQAESLIVTKELVVERFGPLRYTIGTGCSGGSLVQQQVANAYPGVYQGILPQCSFPDAWGTSQQYIDYVGLLAYLSSPEGLLESQLTPAQYWPVYGHPNPANPVSFTSAIPNSGEPTRACPGVPEEDVYDETTNPDGVRCTLQDYAVNTFGVDENGHARRPIGNTGVQYGLSGLLDGTLLPHQFVALNAGVGGFDMDLNPIDERTAADPIALDRAFRTGAVNTGAHMDQVAIIDLGGPDPGVFHDVYRKYAMRDRLVREHGTSANQVFWEGLTPLLGDVTFVDDGIRKMDEWLAVVEADDREIPLPQKIIEAKGEAGVTDRCVAAGGIDDPTALACRTAVDATLFSSPRIEAGGGADAVGYTDDTLECHTVPLEQFDYAGQSFTERFTTAQQETLRAAFPTGVCDYSKPSVGYQETVTWLTYQDDDGSVIYGGEPMGPTPVSVPFGPGSGPVVGACADAPVSGVTDRPQARGEHRASIDCVLHLGIALGTTSTTYSPTRPVTRGQMARFLLNALEKSGTSVPATAGGDAFGDIATSTHRDAINRLAAVGIAKGDRGSYAPAATLTREQMASFLVRTAELAGGGALPAAGTDHFADVADGSVHERAISAGFEAGLFSGTVAPAPGRPGTFAPKVTVLRDQMATFLVRLYDRMA